MKDYTEIVFILDRSGSMQGLEADTIGGFNSVLQKNKELGGDAVVSTILFDDRTEVICDRRDISDVKPITDKEYYVRGCTALLDAVGGAIKHISQVQKMLPKHHRAKNVMFVITTDGYENASRKFTYPKVKELIEKKRKKGWEFIFLGANIDTAAEASRLGISVDNAVPYHADDSGTEAVYETVVEATRSMRTCRALSPNWRDAVDQDNARRS